MLFLQKNWIWAKPCLGKTCLQWFMTRQYSIIQLCVYDSISGRVLVLRSRGCGLKPHQGHCAVALNRTHLPLLSRFSTQKDPSWHNWKILDREIKNQITQTIVHILSHCIALWYAMSWSLVKLTEIGTMVKRSRNPQLSCPYCPRQEAL